MKGSNIWQTCYDSHVTLLSLFSSCILCAVGMICETNVGRIVVDVLTLLVITFYTLSCHSQCLDIQSDKTGNDVE